MLKGAQWRVINEDFEQDIVNRILKNRGLTDPELREEFLNPNDLRRYFSIEVSP